MNLKKTTEISINKRKAIFDRVVFLGTLLYNVKQQYELGICKRTYLYNPQIFKLAVYNMTSVVVFYWLHFNLLRNYCVISPINLHPVWSMKSPNVPIQHQLCSKLSIIFVTKKT